MDHRKAGRREGLGTKPSHLDVSDVIQIHLHVHNNIIVTTLCTFIIIGVWTPLTELLRSWASSSTIHVFLGSVLDTNRDGRRDNDANYTWWLGDNVGGVAIPTHFYAVVVRCLDSSSGAEPADCDPDNLDTAGLLFQHPTELGV